MTVIDKPKLDRAHVRALLSDMLRIRMFEDKCAELYTQEKIRGFLHLTIGRAHRDLVIVAMSARGTAEIEAQAMGAGADLARCRLRFAERGRLPSHPSRSACPPRAASCRPRPVRNR